MVVNHERAWLRLKAYLDTKPSHGTRELHAEMARIEVACEIPEAEEGFDPRPVLGGNTPADDDPRELHEPIGLHSVGQP